MRTETSDGTKSVDTTHGARPRPAVHGEGPDPEPIELRGVTTNNLRDLDVDIPQRSFTVVSGVSGSGKSSLAFDTLYAEGQRRFLESMSTYARQFLQRMEKPPVRSIKNILPSIALRQKGTTSHARSTVGTITELDTHLQMLWAHLGEQRCTKCGGPVSRDTITNILERLRTELDEGARLVIFAEVSPTDEEKNEHVLNRLVEQGYRRFWIDGSVVEIEETDIESMLDAESFPVLIDRISLRDSGTARQVEALDAGMELGFGSVVVDHVPREGETTRYHFHRAFTCNDCGTEFVPPMPALFNPNTGIGACTVCTGFGKTTGLDLAKVIPNPFKTLEKNAIAPFSTKGKYRRRKKMLDFCEQEGIPIDVPWRDLSPADRKLIIDGKGRYKGVRGYFKYLQGRRRKRNARIMLARYRGYTECEACEGGRLSDQARNVFVHGTPLHHVYMMSAGEALSFFNDLDLSTSEHSMVDVLFEEIVLRLRYMVDVGLNYLRLDRQTRTLSGGEFQRLHLTSSIGRALTDTLYVLDEPTAGLHPRDSERLLRALHGLRDLGNTVVVVEHDPEIIEGADWAIELGPTGGEGGGRIMYEGPVTGLVDTDTATGRMLSGRTRFARDVEPLPPAKDSQYLVVNGATQHNLQNIDVEIPLNRLVCITGVSGSGKSTLVTDIIYNKWRALAGDVTVDVGQADTIEGFDVIDDIVLMSQKLMGRSSRSNAATYSKAYDAIRRIMAGTRAAKERGVSRRDFSFNTKGGRCDVCEGTGIITIEMQFMADVELQCEVCEGKRFQPHVLSIRYQGKNIDDILRMTVSEAMTFFEGQRAVTNKLGPLVEVGLGYIRLGQTTATLSGGELQRLKLASHIQGVTRSKKDESLFFIFDEPTVGLHMQDVEVLVAAVRRIVEEGHSALVVEHNTDFIAASDHVIDLGPEGGDGGGQVVVSGTPEDVANCSRSHTGRYLRELLEL